MQLARIEGKAVSTIKHPSLKGWRLLIAQPLDLNRKPDSYPMLVIDSLGANAGDLVMLSTDGKGARKLVGDPASPARYTVIGIVDEGVDALTPKRNRKA